MKTVTKCRLCGSEDIPLIWDFGKSPLANAFKTKKEVEQNNEQEYPLRYFKCSHCHSVQLKDEVDPNILFANYMYESPPNLSRHFKELAETSENLLDLSDQAYILDIGSNNGLLLLEYRDRGFEKIYGVEPAAAIADKARKKGIPVFNSYFNTTFAKVLQSQNVKFDLITCTNCFAHIPDLNDVVEALTMVMKDDGYFIFENAYLLNTLENRDFGQAYFEHFFMHSIYPMKLLFERHGLELFHIEYNQVQMGSIRGYVRKKGNTKHNFTTVEDGISREIRRGMHTPLPYKKFLEEVDVIRERLLNRLKDVKGTVSVYAWPAKMTLLSKYFDISNYIQYITEESDVKVGKFAPGTKVDIRSMDNFKTNPTDYTIVGAYNFANDIKNKHEWYKGTWINPLDP